MTPSFLEVLFDAKDCASVGIYARDEIEDHLEDKIAASGLGKVSGGGGGMGKYNIDIDVYDEQKIERIITLIRKELISLGVPSSSKIIRHKPQRQEFFVYQ